MKVFSKIALAGIVLLIVSSCQKPRSYSVIPAITYKNFTITDSSHAILQISFTDGDGDIGYPSDNTSAPANFYIEYLYDSAGIYVPALFPPSSTPDPVVGDTVAYPYHIPYITPTGKDKSLNGQIQVNVSNWYLPLSKTFEYRVWLIDRAGHISNRVTTPAFTYPF